MRKIHLLIGGWALGLALAAQAPLVLAAQAPLGAPHMDHAVSAAVGPAVADDPDLAKVIAPLAAEIRTSFGRVIAKAPEGLRKGGAGSSPLGNFLADTMREGAAKATGTEVRFAFTNSGGLRRDISPGDLKVQDIYEVLPFENELVVAEYTGAEIIAILKEGILKRGGEPCSGTRVSLTGTPEHPVASFTWSDGKPIDLGATYRAATTDYLLSTGDATPTLKLGRKVVATGVPVRTLVLEVCEAKGKLGLPVLPPEGARYVFSPELAEALRAKTFKF